MATTSLEAIRRIVMEAQTKGFDEAAAKINKVADSHEGLVASTEKVEKSTGSVGEAFKRVQRQLDPNVGAYERYASSIKAVNDGLAQGHTTQARATELFALAEQRLIKATGAATGFSQATGMIGQATAASLGPARHEWINLSRQLQDVGVSLQGGQSPLTVLMQQGSQISDVFISSRASVGDFAKTAITSAAGFLSAWGPAIGGVTLALGGLYLALQKVNEQRENMIATSSGKGRLLGLKPDDIDEMASRSRGPGVSTGEAREGILEGVRAGLASAEVIEKANVSAKQYATTMRMDLVPATKEWMAALAEPVQGMQILEDKLKLGLTPAFKDYIIQLVANGNTAKATALLHDEATRALVTQAQAATASERAWALLKVGMGATGDGLAAFTTNLLTLNGMIPQFINSTAAIIPNLTQLRQDFDAAHQGAVNWASQLLQIPAPLVAVGAAAQTTGAAVQSLNANTTEAGRVAADVADKIAKSSTAYANQVAVMNAVTVEERALATQQQTMNDLVDKGVNSTLAYAQALQAGNKVRDDSATTQAKTIRGMEIEIEINDKIIRAYQMQSSNLEGLIAKYKEEQKIRQEGLEIGSKEAELRLKLAEATGRQTKEISDLAAASQQAASSFRSQASAAQEAASSSRPAAGSVDQVGYSATGTPLFRGSQQDVAAARRQLLANQPRYVDSNPQQFDELGNAVRGSLTGFNDSLRRVIPAGTDTARALDRAAGAANKFASSGGAGDAEGGRSFAVSPGTFSAGGDKPLSQRGSFTSTFGIPIIQIAALRAAQDEAEANQLAVGKQMRDAERSAQQTRLGYASQTIQEQIQALQDQKSALDENTAAIEKETQKRREQLDKQIAKLEKALNPSRPDPYAERNPDYFYRFGTQAFKENDPMQALLSSAEAERDALDAQFDQQKKSVELQQKAIDEQIKGYEAQVKELSRASNLLSAGVDLSAQEVAGIRGIIGSIQGLGDYSRLAAASQTQTAEQINSIIAGASAKSDNPLQPDMTPQQKQWTYGFQRGVGGYSGAFASGGYIPAGSWGIAGESGPEVITRKRAIAGPAQVTPIRAGGDRPIVVNQTIVSQGGMRELRASRGEIAQSSAANLRRSMRMQ